jgi:hypothetical protein
MQIEGRVGPQALSVGAQQPPRLGNAAEVVTQDANGRYYELNYRGFLYTVSTALAGITVAAGNVSPLPQNTGIPIVGVYNPPASLVNLVITRVKIAVLSGTLGGPFAWNVIPSPAAITNAGAQGRNNKTFALGGTAVALSNTTFTASSAAATMFRVIGGPTNTIVVSSTVGGLYSIEEETAGDIIVTPGGFAGVAATAAGASNVVTASMSWAEIPV